MPSPAHANAMMPLAYLWPSLWLTLPLILVVEWLLAAWLLRARLGLALRAAAVLQG
jgi:hypothetical protein